MTTIADHGYIASHHRPLRLRLHAYIRLLRRRWRRRLWTARMRQELTSARLLADVGQVPPPDRSEMILLARVLGGRS